MPQRLQRTRGKNNFTPAGAVYVDRPTWWQNPFQRRPRIGHKRSVILYDAWIRGQLTTYILQRCGFSQAEIATLKRWRDWLMRSLHRLRGMDLQCWCSATTQWCHVPILMRAANA